MTLHRHATLISTNDEARRLANSGAPHGTVVQALQQTGGRGRRGRTWISPPGNLYASFVLRLVCPAIRHGEIGFVMALAVADAVDAAAGHGCARLKWPNDVLLGGAKVAGVLVETSGSAIAGVGINIAHAPAGLAYPTTALGLHGAADVDATLQDLRTAVDRWWSVWDEAGFEPIRTAWLLRGPALGTGMTVTWGADRMAGHFDGLDETGALMLMTPAGRMTITAGEVR